MKQTQIEQILEGFINNILDREEELYLDRITICRSCKLIIEDDLFGEMCTSKKYLNPITDELSSTKKDGFKKGCGCVLRSKCRVIEAKCPLSKW